MNDVWIPKFNLAKWISCSNICSIILYLLCNIRAERILKDRTLAKVSCLFSSISDRHFSPQCVICTHLQRMSCCSMHLSVWAVSWGFLFYHTMTDHNLSKHVIRISEPCTRSYRSLTSTSRHTPPGGEECCRWWESAVTDGLHSVGVQMAEIS